MRICLEDEADQEKKPPEDVQPNVGLLEGELQKGVLLGKGLREEELPEGEQEADRIDNAELSYEALILSGNGGDHECNPKNSFC